VREANCETLALALALALDPAVRPSSLAPDLRGVPLQGAEIPLGLNGRRGDPLNLIRIMPAKG
jgi:hypothetical protein